MESKPQNIVHHTNDRGDPFDEWMESLTDPKAFDKVIIRLKRVAQGNFGDHGPVGEGVSELREHYGPGYRIYFGRDGNTVVLLNGGTKRTQTADVKWAKELWKEYRDA
ncbi:MAG: type II toxin-antitoxin system RelE/ParE family toxin [Candidatus Sulfotelmatobacter sp.]